MESEREKGNWGGNRPGSGRPKLAPEARRVHSTFTLSPEVAAAIAERSLLEGVTRSEALTRCVREWKQARAEQEAT